MDGTSSSPGAAAETVTEQANAVKEDVASTASGAACTVADEASDTAQQVRGTPPT